jgi:NAD-dependent SIR2 family protein deacetylase
LQARLDALNVDWMDRHGHAAMRPDGDVDLDATADFVVAHCDCGGVLKPDVVFFGENVPADRVARCYEAVDALGADGALLVAGSSLTVMSGLRFVKRAARAGTPVVIVNRGLTRGDELATHKLDLGTTEFLVELVQSRRTKM